MTNQELTYPTYAAAHTLWALPAYEFQHVTPGYFSPSDPLRYHYLKTFRGNELLGLCHVERFTFVGTTKTYEIS